MAEVTLEQAIKMAEQFKAQGNPAETERIYRTILDVVPGNVRALNGLGIIVAEAKRLPEAREIFQRTVQTDPNFADAWANLSLACEETGEIDRAIDARRKVLEFQGNFAEHWHRLGVCLSKRGEIKEGIEVLRKSLDLDPFSESIRHDLVFALSKDNQEDAAVEVMFDPILPKPMGPKTVKAVADTMKMRGRFHDATEVWARSLLADPTSAETRGQWAMCLITEGDYERGWREYEARWLCDTFESNIRMDPSRQWGIPPVGSPDVAGKTILIYPEQGLGDVIQFIRYASILTRRGARVIVQTPWPLQTLLESCTGVRLVYGRKDKLPGYDWHIPVMSLPLVMGTTLQTIPAEVPYLKADPARSRTWLERVQKATPPGSRLRVGLAWAGNPKHKNDANRSIDPKLLSALSQGQGVAFFSLQKSNENEKAEVMPPGLRITDFASSLCDFAETAAMIEHLDLVITADTAVAHLAGALAKKVWTLLPFVPDFRWGLTGSTTPWYPTMRLFRQEAYGDWQGVIAKVFEALNSHVQ